MNKMADKPNLYPMMTNPLSFRRGDVVKKIISHSDVTPYVGIITAVVPSTNKVEVQWPHDTNQEDPWDLIKINPFFHPPVVTHDHFYQSYDNSEKVQNEVAKMRHYNVLHDFMKENLQPIVMLAASLYNEGVSKQAAFEAVSKEFDNKTLVFDALDRIYNDSINIKRATDLFVDGEYVNSSLSIIGDSNSGFKVSYALGSENEEYFFDNFKSAVETFKKLDGIFESLNASTDEATLVAKARNSLEAKK